MQIPKVLKRLGGVHVGPENARYCSAVQLERDDAGKPWAVATDGKLLLAATWQESPVPGKGETRRPGFVLQVPAVAFRQACAAAPRFVAVDEAEGADSALSVREHDLKDGLLAYHFERPKAPFPKWRSVATAADARPLLAEAEAGGKMVRTVLGVELLLEVLTLCKELRLDYIAFDVPVTGEHPCRFVARDVDGDVTVFGYLMTVQSYGLNDRIDALRPQAEPAACPQKGDA